MGVLSSMGAGNNSWSRNHSVVVVVVVVFLEKRCSNWKNWKKNFVISSHDHYLMNVTTQLDMCNWVNQVNQVLKGAPPLWGRHGGGDGLPLPHPATATTTKKTNQWKLKLIRNYGKNVEKWNKNFVEEIPVYISVTLAVRSSHSMAVIYALNRITNCRPVLP